MSKLKLVALLFFIGISSIGIYEECCASPPLNSVQAIRLAEEEFTVYLKENGLSATTFRREFVRFEDQPDLWHVSYRTLPGEEKRSVSILVGKYGGVERHTSGPAAPRRGQ